MSRENVELVRSSAEAYSAGNRDAYLDFFAEDVEVCPDASRFPEAEPFRGRQEFKIEYLDAWDERRFEPEDFIDAGDCVVVLQREYRCGRASGVELETETAVVFEVRGGRVVRIRGYMDPVAALEAVGLSEQDAHADS